MVGRVKGGGVVTGDPQVNESRNVPTFESTICREKKSTSVDILVTVLKKDTPASRGKGNVELA